MAASAGLGSRIARAGRWLAVLLIFAQPTWAEDFGLPQSARLASDEISEPASFDMPIGPFADGAIAHRHGEGRVERQVWQIGAAGITSLQIVAPVREALARQGFETLFECDTDTCGGFDFRFGIDVVPPPVMYVDLGSFYYLAAIRGDELRAVLVSHSSRTGFVQITTLTRSSPAEVALPDLAVPAVTATPLASAGTAPLGDLGAQLEADGHVVLADLVFATGARTLDQGRYQSLGDLAAYLAEHPAAQVVLVGHTDASGSLEANIVVSRQRASEVLARLVADYGADARQLTAAGMGYLSPIATNLTDQGRAANRRVEAVLLPSD